MQSGNARELVDERKRWRAAAKKHPRSPNSHALSDTTEMCGAYVRRHGWVGPPPPSEVRGRVVRVECRGRNVGACGRRAPLWNGSPSGAAACPAPGVDILLRLLDCGCCGSHSSTTYNQLRARNVRWFRRDLEGRGVVNPLSSLSLLLFLPLTGSNKRRLPSSLSTSRTSSRAPGRRGPDRETANKERCQRPGSRSRGSAHRAVTARAPPSPPAASHSCRAQTG